MRRHFEGDSKVSMWIAGVHLIGSLVGAMAATFIVNATIMHGQFASPRTLLVSFVFSLMVRRHVRRHRTGDELLQEIHGTGRLGAGTAARPPHPALVSCSRNSRDARRIEVHA